MSLHLTKFQKKLCNELQDGLPICAKPFDDLAKYLNTDEKTVLQQISQLEKLGVIRRISAIINYRALGMISTLVAAHVPQESLQEVVEAVNSLRDVSHNYRREHYYNLWFTLQAQAAEQIKVTLSNLSGRFGIDFHSLPVVRVFKLDVRFDADSEDELLMKDVEKIPKDRPRRFACPSASCEANRGASQRRSSIVELDENQKLILSKLQDDLNVTIEPFDFLCGQGLEREDVLRIIKELIDEGIIRRIAAVVDHRKLGFVANVLFVGEVPQDRIIQAGEKLARFGIVTHCYQRKTFENWPYNLFAMMHSRSMGEIQHVISKFIETEKIDFFELLPTVAELKKQPVEHKFY